MLEIGDLGEVAGKLLADAGADVIRVEPPGGGRSRHVGPFVDDDPGQPSLLHASRNTSKRAVTLDVTRPDGLAIWKRLVGLVDVVIDATTPTLLDESRRGLGVGGDSAGVGGLRLVQHYSVRSRRVRGGTGRRTIWSSSRWAGR